MSNLIIDEVLKISTLQRRDYYLLGSDCFVVLDYSEPNFSKSVVYYKGKRKSIGDIPLHILCVLLHNNENICTPLQLGDVWKTHIARCTTVDETALGTPGDVSRQISEYIRKPLIRKEENECLEKGYIIHAKKVPHYFAIKENDYKENTNITSFSCIDHTEELECLLTSAFQDTNVHAIIGERGIGKTVLAQCFAKKASESGKYEYIIFTRYKNNLKDTISQLPTYARLSESKDLFDEKIYLLKDLQQIGKTLLVIDNYDNSDYCDELCADNLTYTELLSTGCDILFTSCTNLEGCYNGKDDSTLDVTKVKPLPLDRLIKKFREIKGDSNDSKEVLRYLVNDLLKGNTYLVTMAARLSKKMGIEYVIDAFDSLSIENTRPIEDTKDGKKQKPASIYEHYCAFLQNHPIVEDLKYKKLLVNLSLLPLDGLKYDDFFERAFEKKERSKNQALFADLVDHFLAFENDDTIYLHPIIREYIVDKILSDDKLISSYIECSIKPLKNETYSKDIVYWLNIGQAIEKSLKNKDDSFCLWSRARLNAYVASSCDVMSIKESAYNFGAQAVKLLDKVDINTLSDDEKLIIANCYNVSGYAILHRSIKIQQDDWDLAYNSISKAMEILNEIKSASDTTAFIDRVLASLTKVHGNIGACYLKAGNYQKAKEWHECALAERQEMLSRNDSKENKLLIYTTYRCLGTDFFYLSRSESAERVQHLKESYKNNEKSLQGYIDVYGLRHLECTIGSNRLIGTGMELISELQNDESLKEVLGITFDELVNHFYMLLNESVECLADIGIAINSEIKDCLYKIEQLTESLDSRNILTTDELDFNISAVEKLNAVPGISEEVQELLEKVLSTSQKKVK